MQQKRVTSGSDRHPSSSLPVSSGNVPKRPAADVINQVHRRLSGNTTVNGSPSSIPLLKVSTNGPSNGQGRSVSYSVYNDHRETVPHDVANQFRPLNKGLRGGQNIRTRSSVVGGAHVDVGHGQSQTPHVSIQQFSSNNPFRMETNNKGHPKIASQVFVNPKSRRRSTLLGQSRRDTLLLDSNISPNQYNNLHRPQESQHQQSHYQYQHHRIHNSSQNSTGTSTYATPPSGSYPSISSRRPDRMSVIQQSPSHDFQTAATSSNQSLKLPPSIRRQSPRISLSPGPSGPRRLGEPVPPVPPIPDQVKTKANSNRGSSSQSSGMQNQYMLQPKRSFSSDIGGRARHDRAKITSSISMNNLTSTDAEGNTSHSPIKLGTRSRYASQAVNESSIDRLSQYGQPSEHHDRYKYSSRQQYITTPASQSQLGPQTVPRSQTLPDIARLKLETPTESSPRNSPGPKHQLSAKSPYRPLNMPAVLHPRPSDKGHPSTGTPDLKPAQSKTVIGEYSIATGNNVTTPIGTPPAVVSSTQSIRSKSTASKQWSTPRSNGQASVAATRRMLLSPYENFKRISQMELLDGSATYPPEPPAFTPLGDRLGIEKPAINMTEIKAIMRSLITSKKDSEDSNREIIKELQAKGELIVEPQTPAMASKSHRLNIYEKGEILDFRHVYYCGQAAGKKIIGDVRRGVTGNFGFDDDKGDYRVTIGDHIAYRYRILGVLGKGSFGKVLKCVDHRSGKLVALKMIINRKRLHMQALIEADLLKSLSTWDPSDKYHMVRYLDHFSFREHLCITNELLGINLYELIKYNGYKGLPLPLIRHFTHQILESLAFLDSKSIIHCDLKPENIMLCDSDSGKVKIIDFGSSCYESERVYTYIQSRFYRSPEVMLGMPYGRPVDMWSLGCIIPELYTGRPLFMGDNEQEQVACIMEVFGIPDKALISRCARRRLFFDSLGKPRSVVTKRGEQKQASSKSLKNVLKSDDAVFLDFLSQLLMWDPKRRPRPEQALRHEFISGKSKRTISSSSSASSSNIKNSSSNNSLSSIASAATSISSSTSAATPVNTIPAATKNPIRQINRANGLQQPIIATASSAPPNSYYIRRA
ncbi:serine/threonine protein kinase YAK1 [Sugiyamaella lignohabitans]|uniref:dual-specificity kinase n=1 Tax=Sugiyamaella lignohabitans TaxID=796027 RepID=A0A167FSF8_9ASCO|nr:serine/threonine protein kinase YAK1 [Sugiyamaella lignohabitans]ANB15644.1 serine/threonine protein kinase YAK1 [Sugiyamaella lignohabitans]